MAPVNVSRSGTIVRSTAYRTGPATSEGKRNFGGAGALPAQTGSAASMPKARAIVSLARLRVEARFMIPPLRCVGGLLWRFWLPIAQKSWSPSTAGLATA